MRGSWVAALLAAALLASLLVTATADAAVGGLTQKAGTSACVSETGTAGACADGKALDTAFSLAISPDGTSAYVGSYDSDAIAIFDRNTTTGALTQKAGTAGCISETGSAGACVDGKALDAVGAVTVSPDGAHVYVASSVSNAVAIFDRNTATGALTQKAGTAGCISETGSSGVCVDGKALGGPFSVATSANGASVYVASVTSDAVAIFDRNTTTGVLTQKAGTAGCVSETGTAGVCVDGKALDGAFSLTPSANGASVYVASVTSDAVAIFDRNTTTGELTQKAGTAGCISETGSSGVCVDGKALDGAFSLTPSANGASVYVASSVSDAVAIFDRNTTTGTLTQKSGTAGCISETGTAGVCVDGRALDGAYSVAVSPDGASVYVASSVSDAVAIADRNTTTGALTQKTGAAGCVAEIGVVGVCDDAVALDGAGAVAVSPNDGNVYAAAYVSDSISVFDRDLAPETTIDSGPSGLTGDNTPTFTFSSGDAGSTFECRVDSGAFAACSGTGTHTTGVLSDGAHTFEVRAIDPAANADPTPASRSFTVDATAPQTSILSGPSGLTNDPTAGFTFSADDAGAGFECRIDAAAFSVCSGPGNSHTTATLSDGAHTFEVRAIDSLGNTDPTPASRSFTVDTTAPQTTIEAGPSGPTNDTTPTFGFSSAEAGSGFQCRVDSAAFSPCSGPGDTHTTGVLSQGPHTFEVRATDPAGNTDATPASRSFTVDVTAPPTAIDSGPSGATQDSTPTFTFSSAEAGSSFECRIDAGPFAACSDTGSHTTTTLSDGAHTFEVRAIDAASNVDPTPASRSFTVDTAAPQTTIDSGPSGPTNDPTPSFGFSSDEGGSSFECRVDAEAFSSCSGPGTHTTASLGDGPHTFEVRATDPAGNTDASPAARAFSVDTDNPQTTIDVGPTGMINDLSPTFEFSSDEAGSSFECRVDAAAFSPCSGPGDSHTTADLGDGLHTFEVRATDPVGNTDGTPAARTFTVETSDPETTIDSGPADPTNDPTPSFGFSSNEAGSSFECKVDGGSFGACSGPGESHTTAALADGTHTFEVRSTDPVGNTDTTPASFSFTVDTAAPDTAIDSGPSGLVDEAVAVFGFSSPDAGASFECRIDGGAFGPCSGPGDSHSTAALADGAHTFEVRAVDGAGNVDGSPSSRNITVDTTAPQTTIDSGPSGPTSDATPEFDFSANEGGSSFECKIDGGSFGSCSGPGGTHTPSSLSDGDHTFAVRSTDAAGHVDASPATRAFSVDTNAPDTTIDSGAGGVTAEPAPVFTFSASESGSAFECAVDGEAFAACSGDGSHTTAPLADGPHSFEVRAIDVASTPDPTPAAHDFTVDTTSPEVSFLRKPKKKRMTSKKKMTIKIPLVASEPVSYQCKVGKKAFAPCESPWRLKARSKPGKGKRYSISVVATDVAGNVSPKAATARFRLIRKE